jgi:hypothetical protein
MTGRIGDEPNMDPYKDAIESGAVQFLDFTPRDIAAMNLHDAAEYRMAQTKHAHPHYKRIGRMDEVAGRLVTYTADERAEDRFNRRMGFAVAGFLVLLLAAGMAIVGMYIGHGIGWF